MKITFFYTSYDQLEINCHIIKIFKKLNKLNYNENILNIDIIIHNNNNKYNREKIIEKTNIIELKECKYVQNVHVIHTVKNKGYLWGAQEALSDNYDYYKDSDFVIHLNTNMILQKIDVLLNFLFDIEKKHTDNKVAFFVNEFFRTGCCIKTGGPGFKGKGDEKGFKTNFTIFKPLINFYSFYKDESFINKVKKNIRRYIPESIIKESCVENDFTFEYLPNIFSPFKCYSIKDYNKYINSNQTKSIIYSIKCYEKEQNIINIILDDDNINSYNR